MTIRDAIRAQMAAIRAKAEIEIEELAAHLTAAETWLEKDADEFKVLLSKILS